MPRGTVYTPEQLDTIVERARQHMAETPTATQSSVARYSGADITVLKRLQKQFKDEKKEIDKITRKR